MQDTKQRSLLERMAAVLAPASVIIKVLFDLITFLHKAH